MTVSYVDACSSLVRNPAPVLFMDACALLDIVRSPVRESVIADSAKDAHDLCARANGTQPSLWLVTSETVLTEWRENVTSVKEEVEREILKLEARRKHFISAAESVTSSKYQYGQSAVALNLATKLEATSKALLDSCLVVSPDDAHIIKAMNRVKRYLPPAQRGKAEPKDCEIFELFLSLCHDARAAGITDEFLFVSSNTKDYGEANAGGIQPELDRINAKFVHNLAWAVAVINGRA